MEVDEADVVKAIGDETFSSMKISAMQPLNFLNEMLQWAENNK